MYSQPYKLLYVDPPWEYANKRGNDPALGGITYPVMTNQELYDMRDDVRSVIDPRGCALMLWTTGPKLPVALRLIEEWGFAYVTWGFVWIKLNRTGSLVQEDRDVVLRRGVFSGLGHWTKHNMELVLFARRGKVDRIDNTVKQVVFSPLTKHSEKPKVVYTRMEALFGDVPRLEMFARTTHPGWDAAGDEIDGKDIRTFLRERALELRPRESETPHRARMGAAHAARQSHEAEGHRGKEDPTHAATE